MKLGDIELNDFQVRELKQQLTGIGHDREVGQPTIICLCGSTRFYAQFMEANYQETMAGNIVLSVGFYPHATQAGHGEEIGITQEQKIELDRLHLWKIDLADEVLILNVGGYIGESTARELKYARFMNKVVRFLEPHND